MCADRREACRPPKYRWRDISHVKISSLGGDKVGVVAAAFVENMPPHPSGFAAHLPLRGEGSEASLHLAASQGFPLRGSCQP